MAHIALPADVPGIRGPLAFRPDAAKHLLGLAETILRRPASLEPGERETIAAWTSHLNGCRFCTKSHAAAARAWLVAERAAALDQLLALNDTGGFTPKMHALLEISRALQACVLGVRPDHVEAARAAGATDMDIHDTVLITADAGQHGAAQRAGRPKVRHGPAKDRSAGDEPWPRLFHDMRASCAAWPKAKHTAARATA